MTAMRTRLLCFSLFLTSACVDAKHMEHAAVAEKPDAGEALGDSGRAKHDCSSNVSGHAVEGCPCHVSHEIEYCCGLGYGMQCDLHGRWQRFEDGPCNWCRPVEAMDDDAGSSDTGPRVVCDDANATAPMLICD